MMTTTQSQTNSNTNLPLPGPTDREVDHEAQPNVSRNEGVGENAIHEMDSGLSRSRGMYSILAPPTMAVVVSIIMCENISSGQRPTRRFWITPWQA